MKIVGLTGGIACGKSSVSRMMSAEFQVPVVDADEVAHAVLAPGTRTYANVLSAFGPSILQAMTPAEAAALYARGEESETMGFPRRPVDRSKLGALVFADDAKRKQLGQLMNGAIAWALARAVLGHWARGTRVLILDVPLLYVCGEGVGLY
jgi:dephospho-CoA kinase